VAAHPPLRQRRELLGDGWPLAELGRALVARRNGREVVVVVTAFILALKAEVGFEFVEVTAEAAIGFLVLLSLDFVLLYELEVVLIIFASKPVGEPGDLRFKGHVLQNFVSNEIIIVFLQRTGELPALDEQDVLLEDT